MYGDIVQGVYHYTTVHWPDESAKLFSGPPPDIFVSDLYLPPLSGDTIPTAEQRESAAKEAKRVADQFSELYADSSGDDRSRLRKTMDAIADAFDDALVHGPGITRANRHVFLPRVP